MRRRGNGTEFAYQWRYQARVKAAKAIEDKKRRTQQKIYRNRYRAKVIADKEIEQDKKLGHKAHYELLVTTRTPSALPRTGHRMTLINLMDIEGFESLPANPGLQSISANTCPTLDGTNTGTMHRHILQPHQF